MAQMKLFAVALLTIFALPATVAAQEWLTATHQFYEIRYTSENEAELQSVKEILSQFRSSFCKAAGVDVTLADASQIVLELHPKNSDSVQVGYVSLVGGTFDNRGQRGYRGTIRMPGPAAYDGRVSSSSGHPQDRKFFDKLLVHEISPIFIELLAWSKGGRFRGPNWFIQGIEEYFGVFHSTDYWRTDGREVYYERLKLLPDSIDTDFGLNVTDPYNDGFLVMNYLRDTYGEAAIFELIASRERTFGKRMQSATNSRYDEFAVDFNEWKKQIIDR
ncbi:hypothetical protein SH139x_005321 [Planctomycetaceae bacterium SH139]